MRLQTRARWAFERAGAVIALAAACSFPLVAQTQKPAPPPLPKPAVTVAVTALEWLLPSLPGWTKGRMNSDRIDLSETCSYTYADAVYTNGSIKVRITLADTAGNPESLAALATMVTTLADGYSTTINRTTSVTRMTFNGSPAAMRWDTEKLDGEFIVILGGRFVAKAEGTGVDSIETLRGFIERVDLKALADLK